MKKSLMRYVRGFTLFEVIMVIVIVSILSVAALPLLSGSSDQAAKLEAAQVENVILRARTHARTEKTEYQAVFNTTYDTITVSKKDVVVEEKILEEASKSGSEITVKSGTTGTTGTTGSVGATGGKLIPEGGGLTLLAAAVEKTEEDEDILVYALSEGTLTAVDFSGGDTLYFDTAGDVLAGGTVRVDYSDLYMMIAVADKTGVVTVTETWK